MSPYFEKSDDYITLETEFAQNRELLRRGLDPEQRRLLLHLVDAHDAMLDLGVRGAFLRGFRLGAKVVADAFR